VCALRAGPRKLAAMNSTSRQSDTQYAIEASGLRKRYGTTQALDGVDLVVRRGSVLGVLGPNGAGKTTAVRVLATLVAPDEGTGKVAGYDVLRQPARVRERIGLTGQFASVDETLTGTQNLVMIGRLLDMNARDAKARARELLAWFDLEEAAERTAKTYSGGMRRRLDLAASLVGRPEVIFLDEPTTGLDPSKREDMWAVIRRLVADGSTVLLTTQYLDEADALADEISVFDHGRVIAHDTPDGLKRVVGGQTLTVRPSDLARLPEVTAILADIAGMRPEPPVQGSVSAPVRDDAAMAALVSRLTERGIAVTELSLKLPSLDEVFFTLTGRVTDDAELVGVAT
jgi:oleandomycin transport system ATP-binding protein